MGLFEWFLIWLGSILLIGIPLSIVSCIESDFDLELRTLERNNLSNHKLEIKHKRISIIAKILMTIAIFIFAAPIIAGIGFIWYYFCSGFLLFEVLGFFEKFVMGIVSFVLLLMFFAIFL